MTLDLGNNARLELEAAPGGDWLYDCHARRFSSVEHGATATSGFAPLYLARLFGVEMRDWPALSSEALAAAEAGPDAWRSWLDQHRPRMSKAAAAETALLVYPSMERFVRRTDGELGPFQLRNEVLFQPNVPLGGMWLHDEGTKRQVADASDLSEATGRVALAEAVRLSSSPPPGGGAAPGVYVIGHSSLLVRGTSGGVLLDPVHGGRLATEEAIPLRTLATHATAVALTHSHFDHYHVPTLLRLGELPLHVPQVPRPSIVCEDMLARLADFGLPVSVAAWGSSWETGDCKVHVLPFVGEQFLTSEVHPEVRNWGNCYVVETDAQRVLVAVDAGFEPGWSILDEVRRYVADNGPVDVMVAQMLGLRVAFGGGDPDLQLTALTCPHRAEEAFELLAPSRRVTLSVADLPELMRVSGARTLVPYGQFQFGRGLPIVVPTLFDAAQRALRDAGVQAEVVPLRVGEGVGPGGEVIQLPPA